MKHGIEFTPEARQLAERLKQLPVEQIRKIAEFCEVLHNGPEKAAQMYFDMTGEHHPLLPESEA